jgi:hypothetical protein
MNITSNTTISGFRHKKYMIYLDKDKTETTNSYFQRLFFVVTYITKSSYDELVLYSKYYVNIKRKGLVYSNFINDKLSLITGSS